jgi:hypothetical protein
MENISSLLIFRRWRRFFQLKFVFSILYKLQTATFFALSVHCQTSEQQRCTKPPDVMEKVMMVAKKGRQMMFIIPMNNGNRCGVLGVM